MSLAVEFRREAQAEFVDDAAHYEAQRQGLGARFIAEIERCVSLASEQPQIYRVAHNGTRRVPARRFPYCVYFRPHPERIVVLAVFHSSRDPQIWRQRS